MNSITQELNYLLADSQVLYTKLHNFHWHVRGPHFYQIHEKTEELYNHFSSLYDALAERLIQLGGTPYITLKEILENTRIEEFSSHQFQTQDIYSHLNSDFRFLLGKFNELAKNVDEDSATTALIDEQITFLEKEIWMLEAALG